MRLVCAQSEVNMSECACERSPSAPEQIPEDLVSRLLSPGAGDVASSAATLPPLRRAFSTPQVTSLGR